MGHNEVYSSDSEEWLDGKVDEDSTQSLQGDALAEFPHDKAASLECQEILRNWISLLEDRAGSNTETFRIELWDSVDVLKEIQDSFDWYNYSFDDDFTSKRSRLWAWPSEEDIATKWGSIEDYHIQNIDVSLSSYLKRPWLQRDVIDASAINAYIFHELLRWVQDSKAGVFNSKPNWSYILSGGKIWAALALAIFGPVVGFFARWIVLPAIALVLLVYGLTTAAAVAFSFWGLYLIYRIAMIPSRWRFHKARKKVAERADDTIIATTKAWRAARGETINPTRLKELVLKAEDCGASFRPILHTLIDRAIQRDPAALSSSVS